MTYESLTYDLHISQELYNSIIIPTIIYSQEAIFITQGQDFFFSKRQTLSLPSFQQTKISQKSPSISNLKNNGKSCLSLYKYSQILSPPFLLQKNTTPSEEGKKKKKKKFKIMCNPNKKPITPNPHLYITLKVFPTENQQNQQPNQTLKQEAQSLFLLSLPIAVTALLFYSRSIISMLFLGSLGDLPLAAGSLAIAFANITGYSVLSGLSLGMEPLCSQAFGANQTKLLSLTLCRAILFLLSSSIPICLIWLNMSKILLFLGQDREIVMLSQTYLIYSIPDLLSFSFIHPLRIYLRSQGIMTPLTIAAAIAAALHLPLTYVLVSGFGFGFDFGPAGVAAASAGSNFLLLLCLLFLLGRSGGPMERPAMECLTGWGPLVRLAGPSCLSVCMEWWWYELMIILCGLLPDPKPAVATMGVLIQTTALIYVFPSSLSFGVSARVGNEIGAGRPNRARISAAVAIVFSGLIGFIAMGFATGMKDRWAQMFTNDADILKLTATALPILGLCELGNCPQTVGCGVLRGTARPTHAAHINLGAFYVVGLPIAVGLAFGLDVGFCGLWMGLLAAQICCAGLMMFVVGTTDWDAQAKRAQLLTCAEGEELKINIDEETIKNYNDNGDYHEEKEEDEVCCVPLVSIKMDETGR